MSGPGGHPGVTDLSIDVEGDGRPILLLHGLPDRAALWREVTPQLLEAGRRVIAPDQRGCGASRAPAERKAYRLDRLVRDAVDVLNALDVREPVDVVGHDWGAMVGW